MTWSMNTNDMLRASAVITYLVLLIMVYAVDGRDLSIESNLNVAVWEYDNSTDNTTHTLWVEHYALFRPSLRQTVGGLLAVALTSELAKGIFDMIDGSYKELLVDRHNPWRWLDVAIIDGILLIVLFQVNGETNFFVHLFVFGLNAAFAFFAYASDKRIFREDVSFWRNWKHFIMAAITNTIVWASLLVIFVLSDKRTYNYNHDQAAPVSILVATIFVILGGVFLQMEIILTKMEVFSSNPVDNNMYGDNFHTFILWMTRTVVISLLISYLLNDPNFSIRY